MHECPHLDTYWLTFPRDPSLPYGIGVTAFSEQDAFALMRRAGVDAWFADACEVVVTMGVRIEDLHPSAIVPNIGPMQFRGVWYPVCNIGWGAPKDRLFVRLPRRAASLTGGVD